MFFAALQAAFALVTDRWWPALRHPEYGRKLALLKAQQTAHSGQPLLLALGTSRMAFGFCAAGSENSDAAWQFNFGLTGIGPVQELVCLHRLLWAGVQPAQLLIEIHPAFLHQTCDWCESRAIDVRKLDWHDLSVVRRHAFEPRELASRWIVSRLSPWYSYRLELLRRVAPGWVDEAHLRDEQMLGQTDASGWSRFPLRPADDAERQRVGRWCADLYTRPLTDFEVSDVARRAIAEMLEVCRRRQIDAALVLMPEGELFRGRYPSLALPRIDAYLAEVRRAFDVRVFDCRRWCLDEQFCDGQHLLPEGAEAFTARLRGDLLAPWLAELRRPAAELAERSKPGLRQ
ncbi:MAG TPA: hypothetical protein PK867_12030 [Pirellulales bacterium]|nr:hypothetical protein [Pirellulales bacterium]